jgi:metallophosphoesterase (TIGR00282 family)
VRILFLGDVFGEPGVRAVEQVLPGLREQIAADFCVVNGENAYEGRGIRAAEAERLLAAGADVLTLGNWTLGQRAFGGYLAEATRVLRPANLAIETPGRGLGIYGAADGTPVAVLNVLGQFSLEPAQNPFAVVDELVDRARSEAKVVVVDVHAEATSEKVALARWLDGRVTAVIGTHTHVQTADARVLPGGTAAITDVGMSGPHDSVIGVRPELAIARLRGDRGVRLRPAKDGVRVEGLIVDCDAEGRATACEALRIALD